MRVCARHDEDHEAHLAMQGGPKRLLVSWRVRRGRFALHARSIGQGAAYVQFSIQDGRGRKSIGDAADALGVRYRSAATLASLAPLETARLRSAARLSTSFSPTRRAHGTDLNQATQIFTQHTVQGPCRETRPSISVPCRSSHMAGPGPSRFGLSSEGAALRRVASSSEVRGPKARI